MPIADTIGAILGQLTKIISNTIKVSEPMILVEILYVSTVIVPMVVLSVIYIIFMWASTNSVTSFMTSGTFAQTGHLDISPTSPMMILFYSGIVIALIMFIIFLINGLFWQSTSKSLETLARQRYIWIFWFALSLLFIPILFLVLNFFSQVIGKLFINISMQHWNQGQLLQTNSTTILNNICNNINLLNSLGLNILQTFDEAKFSALYSTMANTQIVASYQNLQKLYSVWVESWNTGMVNGFLKDYANALNNQKDLSAVFNTYNPFFSSLNQLASEINTQMLTLKAQISTSAYNDLENMIGTYFTASSNNITTILSQLQNQTSLYANGSFSASTGNLLETNNIVFETFYLLTGHQVASIAQMLNHWPIPIDKPFLAARAIFIGAFTSGVLIKVFLNLTLIIINRLYSVGALTIWGLIAVARGVNDLGATAKVWFREVLASMLALIVVVINFQVFQIIIWSIINSQGANAWYNQLDQSAIGNSAILNEIDLKSIFLLVAIVIFALTTDIMSQKIIQKIKDGELNNMNNMAQNVLGGSGSMNDAKNKGAKTFGTASKNLKGGLDGLKKSANFNANKSDFKSTGFKGSFFKALSSRKGK